VERGLDFLLEGLDFGQTAAFDVQRDIVGETGRGGQRTGRIPEGKNIGESDLLQKGERLAEFFLGLARITDDDIRAQTNVRHQGAKKPDAVQIIFPGVSPFHPGQNGAGSGLNREMDLAADFRRRSHRLGQSDCEILGMGGDETDPDRPLDRRRGPEQFRKIPASGRIPVTVDVLPKELDFQVTARGQVCDLGQDRFERPELFPSAGERHDAIGAKIVAPFHDRDESADGAFPEGRHPILGPFPVPGRGDYGLKSALRGDLGEVMDLIRAEDEIHAGLRSQKMILPKLGDASGDSEKKRPPFFQNAHSAQEGHELVFRFGPDRAGIDDDDVGVLEGLDMEPQAAEGETGTGHFKSSSRSSAASRT
jgi:hypothetical protein